MKKNIIIIGSGFSSISAACFLAKAGHCVQILKKNSSPGGHARQFKKDGFTFDIGPSWYWMPDVFEIYLAILIERLATIIHLKN
jgi:phytoene desaturase